MWSLYKFSNVVKMSCCNHVLDTRHCIEGDTYFFVSCLPHVLDLKHGYFQDVTDAFV